MSETKHTPGPWRYNIETGYRKIDVVTAENANLIAELPFSGSMAPEANARLIAAAPDMLEALEAVIGSHEALVIKDKPLPDARFETVSTEAIAAARAALAKAEGRS